MLADILGYPLHAVDIPAASGRGAALLGARAAGYLDEPALLRILTPRSRPVADPRDATAAVYALRRARFYRTLQALRHEKAGTAIGLADDASSTVPSPNGVEPGFPDSRSRAATTQ
jgi:xylulokinase